MLSASPGQPNEDSKKVFLIASGLSTRASPKSLMSSLAGTSRNKTWKFNEFQGLQEQNEAVRSCHNAAFQLWKQRLRWALRALFSHVSSKLMPPVKGFVFFRIASTPACSKSQSSLRTKFVFHQIDFESLWKLHNESADVFLWFVSVSAQLGPVCHFNSS